MAVASCHEDVQDPILTEIRIYWQCVTSCSFVKSLYTVEGLVHAGRMPHVNAL